MKLFGTLSELVKVAFRSGGRETKLDAATQTGSQTDVTFRLPDLVNNSGSPVVATIVEKDLAQTLTNKSISGATNTLSNIPNSATTATALNIVSAIIARDASGNFAASTITATSFSGPLTGNVTGNVSGTSANVTGTVAIANGGTGQTTQQAALNALSGTQVSGRYLRSDGTNTSLSAIQAADVPTLNQNTTGSAATFTGSLAGDVSGTQSATSVDKIKGKTVSSTAPTDAQHLIYNNSTSQWVPASISGDITMTNAGVTAIGASKVTNSMLAGSIDLTTKVTGSLPIANGGTGQATQQAAMNALAGTQTANRVLRSDGTNTTLSQVALATDVSGTLPIGNGGTGQTTANAALNALLPSQTSAANKYLKSDGTNTSWASASGGAGEINAVLNSSGADGTTGWTGTSVVTGSNSPLNPIITTAFSISNAATTESSTSGGYYPFTLPTGLMNRKLKIEFSYTTPATDVYKVSVYKGSTRVALSTDSGSPASTSLPASVTGGKFVAYFDTDSSSSWTVSVTRTSGTTGPVYITNVIVGPGIQPQGAVVGEWVSYTPTGSWTTNTTYTGRYRRVGDSAEIVIDMAFSGAPAGSTFLTLSSAQLLNGLNTSVDTSKFPNNTDVRISLGTWTGLDTAVNGSYGGTVSWTGGGLEFGYVSGAGAFSALSLTGPVSWNTGDNISFRMTVPIAEWAGSGTLTVAQNDVEFAYNTTAWGTTNNTAFGYGPAGSAITGALSTEFTQRVRFQTPIQATDILTLEFRNSSSDPWVPQSAYFAALTDTIPQYTGIIASGATDTHGAGLFRVSGSTTDIDVGFGRYVNRVYNGTTMLTKAWANGPLWRVRKQSAGAAVGFGIVSPGVSAGLVSASGLPGNTTGNAIASGYVGQLVSFTERAVTSGTANYAATSSSLGQLTTGIWMIFPYVVITGGSGATSIDARISTNNTADGTGLIGASFYRAVPASVNIGGPLQPSYVVVSAATYDIYGKATSGGAGAVCTFGGHAVRIA